MAEAPIPSVTLIVTVDDPATVGLPLIVAAVLERLGKAGTKKGKKEKASAKK